MNIYFSHPTLVSIVSLLGAAILYAAWSNRSDSAAALHPPWSIWHLCLFLIGLEIVSAIVAAFVDPNSWFLRKTFGLGEVLLGFYPLVATLIFLYVIGSPITARGIGPVHLSSKNVLVGVKWGSAALCVVMVLGVMAGDDATRPFKKYGNNPAFQLHETISGALTVLFKLIFWMGIASLSEEITYRGLLYRTLRVRMPPSLSTVVSAWCFVAPHGVANVPIFLLGCGNAMLVEKYGSLIPPVIIHAMWNIGIQIIVWFLIDLNVDARKVFGIGFVVTLLMLLSAWAALRIRQHEEACAAHK
jgi:membrane protease YdiL (CAAX protease family)